MPAILRVIGGGVVTQVCALPGARVEEVELRPALRCVGDVGVWIGQGDVVFGVLCAVVGWLMACLEVLFGVLVWWPEV